MSYNVFDQELKKITDFCLSPDTLAGEQIAREFNDFFKCFKSVVYDNDPIMDKELGIPHKANVRCKTSVGQTYDEFDVVFQMNLPNDVQITQFHNGYYFIEFTIPPNIDTRISSILNNWKTGNYINSNRFLLYYQEVIDRILNVSNNLIGGLYVLHKRESIPGLTLEVSRKDSNIKFTINIIFAMGSAYWPIEDDRYREKWLAEPVKLIENAYYWRVSFEDIERNKLFLHRNMVNPLRLIKRIRQMYKITFLTSYFIDTLFMNEADIPKNMCWNYSMGTQLVHMLEKLLLAFNDNNLTYYWSNNQNNDVSMALNVFNELSNDQLTEGKNTITSILDSVQSYLSNPMEIRTLLLTENEMNWMKDIDEVSTSSASVSNIRIRTIRDQSPLNAGSVVEFNRNRPTPPQRQQQSVITGNQIATGAAIVGALAVGGMILSSLFSKNNRNNN